MMHLAHVNIGTMLGPITSNIMAEFRAEIAKFNALAEQSPGFIWRLQTASGDTADINVFEDDRIFITMSVWQSVEDLFKFTYRSDHVNMFRRRREWFPADSRSELALWWIPKHHIPTIEEAKTRLASVAENGPSPFAFTFKSRFPPMDG